jgi:hypothetical protein
MPVSLRVSILAGGHVSFKPAWRAKTGARIFKHDLGGETMAKRNATAKARAA